MLTEKFTEPLNTAFLPALKQMTISNICKVGLLVVRVLCNINEPRHAKRVLSAAVT